MRPRTACGLRNEPELGDKESHAAPEMKVTELESERRHEWRFCSLFDTVDFPLCFPDL